jgi:hypothetical protein
MKNETIGYAVYGGCRNHILKANDILAANSVGAALYQLTNIGMAGAVRDLAFKRIMNPLNDATPYRCVASSIYKFMRLI